MPCCDCDMSVVLIASCPTPNIASTTHLNSFFRVRPVIHCYPAFQRRVLWPRLAKDTSLFTPRQNSGEYAKSGWGPTESGRLGRINFGIWQSFQLQYSKYECSYAKNCVRATIGSFSIHARPLSYIQRAKVPPEGRPLVYSTWKWLQLRTAKKKKGHVSDF